MTGKTIARYELQHEIGRGGMAVVYLARDPSFGRNVAVKLVSISLQGNPIFRERFEREAHLIAGIEHPAIVPVYDFGEQDGQLYLVMRHMAGGSLADVIRKGRFSLREAARLLAQIAPALDVVQERGIVHRDLKPGNILLDSFGNAAISDFGIAHLSSATTDLTGSAVIGTPTYMSPEQVRGDQDLDGRSDIYALGVILFEMLTGRGPYQAPTPLSAALKHLTEPIPSIRSARPDLPVEVEQILNKALAKDREMRHASASELARELETLTGGLPVEIAESTGPASTLRRQEAPTELELPEAPVQETGPKAAPADNSPSARPAIPAAKPAVPPASRRSLLLPALAVGGLLVMVCGALGLGGVWAGLGLNGLRAASPTFAATTVPTAPLDSLILFSDDFSDPQSGWPSLQNDEGEYSYQPDGYHIVVEKSGAALWAKTNRADADAAFQVQARPVRAGMDGYYGLLCRIRDADNFYYFVVRSDGTFNIGKYKAGGFQPLFSPNWSVHAAIKPGGDNLLRAECDGPSLRFYANGVLLGAVTDAEFTAGASGIIAAALDGNGAEVVFNDYQVVSPGQ